MQCKGTYYSRTLFCHLFCIQKKALITPDKMPFSRLSVLCVICKLSVAVLVFDIVIYVASTFVCNLFLNRSSAMQNRDFRTALLSIFSAPTLGPASVYRLDSDILTVRYYTSVLINENNNFLPGPT